MAALESGTPPTNGAALRPLEEALERARGEADALDGEHRALRGHLERLAATREQLERQLREEETQLAGLEARLAEASGKPVRNPRKERAFAHWWVVKSLLVPLVLAALLATRSCPS